MAAIQGSHTRWRPPDETEMHTGRSAPAPEPEQPSSRGAAQPEPEQPSSRGAAQPELEPEPEPESRLAALMGDGVAAVGTAAQTADEAAADEPAAAAAAAAARPLTKLQKAEAGLMPYVIVNSSYLLFTVTDGAVRMLVLLHARTLDFTAWEIALMFTLYEAAGVVTNLLAGVAGARWGIKCTLMAGLTLQLAGLAMLLGWDSSWEKSTAITYVTLAQMLCGIAKDLVKLGGKTVSKLVTPDEQKGQLFQLVAAVTGWKNSLKGGGYFLGSVLLLWKTGPNGTWAAVFTLMGIIVVAYPWAALRLSSQLGRDTDKNNATLRQVFSLPPDASDLDRENYWNRNWLSFGRCFLFAARDCWFEVPLPIFLRDPVNGLGWSAPATGAFLGGYIICYGQVQANAMIILRPLQQFDKEKNLVPNKWHVTLWALLNIPPVVFIGGFIQWSDAFACILPPESIADSNASTVEIAEDIDDASIEYCDDAAVTTRVAVLVIGVVVFAFVFAINSAINSGMIAGYSSNASAAKNMGFYYMSNAVGRLCGTLISGVLYSNGHFAACFWAGAASFVICAVSSIPLRDDGALRCGKRVACCVDQDLKAP